MKWNLLPATCCSHKRERERERRRKRKGKNLLYFCSLIKSSQIFFPNCTKEFFNQLLSLNCTVIHIWSYQNGPQVVPIKIVTDVLCALLLLGFSLVLYLLEKSSFLCFENLQVPFKLQVTGSSVHRYGIQSNLLLLLLA